MKLIEAEQLNRTLADLLREYRSKARPGAYFFIGERIGDVVRKIEEVYVAVPAERIDPHAAVVFGFIEEEAAGDSPVPCECAAPEPRVSFSHSAAGISVRFKEQLMAYLRSKLGGELQE